MFKKIAEQIIKSKPELFENEINRIKIEKLKKIIRKKFKKLDIIKIDEMKNLEEIEEVEMETSMLKWKIIVERINNNLKTIELKELEVGVEEETKIFRKKEKKVKKE